MSLIKILEKHNQLALSNRDKGDRFEKLILGYFKTDPTYTSQIKNIWPWHDFPFRPQNQDLGIDLVAETFSGKFWAIQCKNYDLKRSVKKGNIDSFLEASTRQIFDRKGDKVHFAHAIIVTATDHWGPNATKVIQEERIVKTTKITIADLENAPVDWHSIEKDIYGENAVVKKKVNVFAHQQAAIKNALEHFKHHNRGKLIMACGTGKTYTSLRIAERFRSYHLKQKNVVILYLVPSISLVKQTLNEWSTFASKKIYPICVCSDPRVSQVKQYDAMTESVEDLGNPATTNSEVTSEEVQAGLASAQHELVVIFSTYHSIRVIIDAQKKSKFTFDLAVCDEAHRTAAISQKDTEMSYFRKILDDDLVWSEKRMFMTATPKIYTESAKQQASDKGCDVASMDDEATYGKEFYKIGFGTAVERGLLSDYKVISLEINQNHPTYSLFSHDVLRKYQPEDLAKMVGVISCLGKQVEQDGQKLYDDDPAPMNRSILFTNNISNSKKIKKDFYDLSTEVDLDAVFSDKSKVIKLRTDHVDGGMGILKRSNALKWLEDESANKNECRMLTNVRCLGEGIDVPSLDAAIFWSDKQSEIDVVQAVGRIMRKKEGKKYGYIIIPIFIDIEADQEKEIDLKYKTVWKILRALRAHDDRLDIYINKLRVHKGRSLSHGHGGFDPLVLSVPQGATLFSDEEKQGYIYGKIVNKVGDRMYWDKWVDMIAQIQKKEKERIKEKVKDDKLSFLYGKFVEAVRSSVNIDFGDEDAINLLSDHLVTKPIFNTLFPNYKFSENNEVAKTLEGVIGSLDDFNISAYEERELERFYESVKKRVEGISESAGKQELIKDLYNKYLVKIDTKRSKKLGTVYTPIEIVDFMIQSTDVLLEKYFDKRITNEGVQILDPFTGTGTYITRLLQSGFIEKKDLERKYEKEIWANEIELLPYYVSDVNIESAYQEISESKEYKEFDNMLLIDTFQFGEKSAITKANSFFEDQTSKAKQQHEAKLTLIIANPPYSVIERTSYPQLNKKLKATYGKFGKANVFTGNAYVKAFRWATDKLDEGIIAYITPSSWLTENGGRGIRHHFEKEFHAVYVYDLKGNEYGSNPRGTNVFGIREGISITFLIKKPKRQEKANIYYAAIDENTKKKERLAIIKNTKSVINIDFKRITPNPYDDWLHQRVEFPEHYIPLYAKKGGVITEEGHFFRTYSNGYKTGNDAQLVNFSKVELHKQVESLVAHPPPPPKNFGDAAIGH